MLIAECHLSKTHPGSAWAVPSKIPVANLLVVIISSFVRQCQTAGSAAVTADYRNKALTGSEHTALNASNVRRQVINSSRNGTLTHHGESFFSGFLGIMLLTPEATI
jgi:hypothetical protein